MKKPIITFVLSLALVGAFLSSSVLYQSCGDKKTKNTDIYDELNDVSDKYAPEEEEGGGYSFSDEEGASSTASTYSAGTSTSSATDSQYSTARGPYLVVAGNYLLEDNADAMLKKLNSRGYNGAEKVIFDLSQYHTVLAGRYSTQSAARSVSTELKNNGIDNYILKK